MVTKDNISTIVWTGGWLAKHFGRHRQTDFKVTYIMELNHEKEVKLVKFTSTDLLEDFRPKLLAQDQIEAAESLPETISGGK